MGQRVIEALGIGTSATHMEWFYGPKGLRFSEIGCRPPGVGAWDLYSAGNDVDVYREWAHAIVARRPEQPHAPQVRRRHRRAAPRPRRPHHAATAASTRSRRGSASGSSTRTCPTSGTATQPVEAGYMANAYVRMRHPDYDTCAAMLDDVGRTVHVTPADAANRSSMRTSPPRPAALHDHRRHRRALARRRRAGRDRHRRLAGARGRRRRARRGAGRPRPQPALYRRLRRPQRRPEFAAAGAGLPRPSWTSCQASTRLRLQHALDARRTPCSADSTRRQVSRRRHRRRRSARYAESDAWYLRAGRRALERASTPAGAPSASGMIVRRHRDEVADAGGTPRLAIAGGHVGMLLRCLRLFGSGDPRRRCPSSPGRPERWR